MNREDLMELADMLHAIADGAEWECYWKDREDEDGNVRLGFGHPLGRDIEYCIAKRIPIRIKPQQHTHQ